MSNTCTQQLKDAREQLKLTQQSKEPLDNKNKDFLVMVKKKIVSNNLKRELLIIRFNGQYNNASFIAITACGIKESVAHWETLKQNKRERTMNKDESPQGVRVCAD